MVQPIFPIVYYFFLKFSPSRRPSSELKSQSFLIIPYYGIDYDFNTPFWTERRGVEMQNDE